MVWYDYACEECVGYGLLVESMEEGWGCFFRFFSAFFGGANGLALLGFAGLILMLVVCMCGWRAGKES